MHAVKLSSARNTTYVVVVRLYVTFYKPEKAPEYAFQCTNMISAYVTFIELNPRFKFMLVLM